MAKRKINKSKAIREYHAAHPDEKPMAVVQGLKKKRVRVTAQQVSTTLSNARRKLQANGRRQKAKASQRKQPVTVYHPSLAYEQIRQAAELVRTCGGMDEAVKAVQAAEEIAAAVGART